jgi:Zn finger protein HypA/HybF involved in hydrogenase expression
VFKVKCRQCEHEWKPRTPSPPLCPACKRTDWNVAWKCSQCGNEEPEDRRAAGGLLCADCHSQVEGEG